MVTATKKKHALLHKILCLEDTTKEHGSSFIPIDDPVVYDILAEEIMRMTVFEPGKNLVLITDSKTARSMELVDGERPEARQIYIFGALPPNWFPAPNLKLCTVQEVCPGPDDRFLVVMSDHISLAVLGEERSHGSNEDPDFKGFWTGLRSSVYGVAKTLLEGLGVSLPDSLVETNEACLRHDLSHATFVMSILTRHLSLLQRDAAMDKNDLSSVLEILKAISSKRRCHDVLYVFVEQIARIVNVSRCSVVRVWTGSNTGHVLASHDDERIHDLTIELAKYPELRHALDNEERLVINQADRDPITSEVADDLQAAQITSLLVLPIVLHDPNIGSLLLRAARSDMPFTMREIRFCEIVAEAASNALERSYLFESIQRANERLEHLAVTDGLTGLKNHRFFRERLEDEFERARRYTLPLSVLIFDVDNFKQINDTYGHLQGDTILRHMAQRTMKVVRKSDIVARYGGEEFTVIMPQTNETGARAEAERLLQALRDPPYPGMPHDHPVTVSIGLAILDHDSVLDCEALIRIADSALYEAKRQGKNRYIIGDIEGSAT